jgi:hypothetical protein
MYDPKVNSAGRICKIGGRCSDTESPNKLADVRGKISLIFYWDRRVWWVGEVYTGCYTRNVRSGLGWFKTDTRKQKDEERI